MPNYSEMTKSELLAEIQEKGLQDLIGQIAKYPAKPTNEELIKVLILEVKKTTDNLVRFNNSFFLDGLEKDSKAYKKYLIYESLNGKTNE